MSNVDDFSGGLLSLIEKADPREILSRRNASLVFRLLGARSEEEGKPLVLIEGDAESLLVLADLLIAQALDLEDCGVQVEADQRCFFSITTEYGLYIHRLPCINEELKRGTRS